MHVDGITSVEYSYSGNDKISLIKDLHQKFGWGLKEAKDFAEGKTSFTMPSDQYRWLCDYAAQNDGSVEVL